MRFDRAVIGVAVGVILQVTSASAQESPQFDQGFAALSDKWGVNTVGVPLDTEFSNPLDPTFVIQPTTLGLMYWSPEHSPTFTDGWVHYSLSVKWEGESLDPPPQPSPMVQVSASDPASYIRSHSKYGERAVCVSRIETGSWTAYYNPVSVRGWHAQGYFGWLPPTFASVSSGAIMNLADEVAAFDVMLDRGRGKEFNGILTGRC